MNNKYIEQSVNRLDIEMSSIGTLINHQINTLGELSEHSKTDLKKYNIPHDQIDKIQIELQLLGLNLKNGL